MSLAPRGLARISSLPVEVDLISYSYAYVPRYGPFLSLQHASLSRELTPLLELPVSRLRLRSTFPPQVSCLQSPDSLLEDPFFVLEVLILSSRSLLRSCFLFKTAISFVVLTPPSRRSHLQGANSLLQGVHNFEVTL